MFWIIGLACAPSTAPVGELGLAQIGVRLTGDPGDEIGWDLVAVDLDGDGRADVATSSFNRAAFSMVDPLRSGPIRDHASPLEQPAAELAGLGDTDGDGLGDLAIGLQRSTPTFSRSAQADEAVAIVSGADPERVVGFLHNPRLGPSVGASHAVEAIGDVDADGLADLVVGDQEGGAEYAGRVWVVRGPLVGGTSLDDAALVLDGAGPQERIGGDRGGLGAGGDWDGDGTPDLATSGSALELEDPRLYLVSGAEVGQLGVRDVAYAAVLGQGYDTAAFPTRGAGDLDGDGQDDLVVGATDAVGARAAIAWGPVSGDLALASLVDGVDGDGEDQLESIATVGDLDGDGVADLALGAPASWDLPGSVAVVYGPIQGRVAYDDADARLIGESVHSETGHVVTGLGDVDGDGFDDLGVGAYLAVPSSVDDDLAGGAIYIVFGGQ